MGRHKNPPNKATIERRSDNWRQSIQASSLIKRLKDHADGKLEKPMDATQIKAAEIILSRLVPTLSSVEQTIHDESANKSESELIAALVEHLKAHPDVAQSLGIVFVPPKQGTDTHVTH